MNQLGALEPISVRALLQAVLDDTSSLPAELDTVSFLHLVTDSRDVQDGDAFIALQGTSADGHQFAAKAVSDGARVVFQDTGSLCSDDVRVEHLDTYWLISIPGLVECLPRLLHQRYLRARDVQLLAVTGTNGKSSVTQYIAQLATMLNRPCGVIGTVGNGIWPNLKPTRNTTPGLAIVLRILDEWARAGLELAAVEVSSHGLDQGRVQGLTFATAALTNLTQDHLDYHGDMASYYQTKRRLFTEYGVQSAFINTDDPFGQRLVTELPAAVSVVEFGAGTRECNGEKRLFWHSESFDIASGINADISSPWGNGALTLPLIGGFNLSNATLAVAMLASLSMDFNQLLDAARHLEPVAGRMELLVCPDKPSVIVDFAHTPDALDNVLSALQQWNTPITLVFGCGGDRDRAKRPLMMEVALRQADTIWLTDDNPRYENPDQIWSDALAVPGHEIVNCKHDREAAIQAAVMETAPGGLLVVAGKGHESTQDVQGQKIPFSDLQVLKCMGYQRAGSDV